MPPLKLAISLLVMILGASGKKGGGGSAVSVEEMRELLVSSMQTTISLTQLVEQQTKRISEITSFVDDTKVLIEKLKEDLAASEERLAQKIEEVKESTREEDEAPREKDVVIVSGEEESRDSSCARVCAGTTPRGATDWVNYSTSGIYTDVDISKCGFVTTPTVTTSMEGSTSHWGTTGSSEIYSVTTSGFRIYIVSTAGRDGGANEMTWNMEWIAVGFTC